MKPRKVTLRAFRIDNNTPTRSDSGLLDTLSNKLLSTTIGDRRMILNETDPHEEEDLILNFKPRSDNSLLEASILRMRGGDDTVSIPEHVFTANSFLLSDLKTIGESSPIYKDIQYILVSKDIVIVCWYGNKTIKSIEAYINWLLKKERKSFIYELTPMFSAINAPAAKDLKEIVMTESSALRDSKKNNKMDDVASKIIDLKKAAIDVLFNDMPDLDDTVLRDMVSARLFIKFNKKPKEMKQEDYDRNFGAMMKPISDLEDVRYITKNGKTVKASEILLAKSVDVDITTNNQVSESSLFLEMEKFLKEILNKKYEKEDS